MEAAQSELDKTMAILKEKQDSLAAVEAKIAELQATYDQRYIFTRLSYPLFRGLFGKKNCQRIALPIAAQRRRCDPSFISIMNIYLRRVDVLWWFPTRKNLTLRLLPSQYCGEKNKLPANKPETLWRSSCKIILKYWPWNDYLIVKK